MLWGIPCWKGWRRKRESRRKACGLVRLMYRRGSGDGNAVSVGDGKTGEKKGIGNPLVVHSENMDSLVELR